jgi:hypothetical protein
MIKHIPPPRPPKWGEPLTELLHDWFLSMMEWTVNINETITQINEKLKETNEN